MSRTLIVFNPNAGSAEDGTYLKHAEEHQPGVTLRETQEEGDARELAARAAAEGFDLVVAAGGDGTVNEVVNGLMRHGETAADRPALGIVPLGTGNDLCRTLELPQDALAALAHLPKGARRALDVIQLTHDNDDGTQTVRYAANVCAGGFTGEVDEAMSSELKETWGPFAYLLGAAKALPDLEAYHTTLAWEDGPAERCDVLNIVVANGRTAAGGKPAAPRANPEDGFLDVVVVRDATAVELAGLAALVFAGDYLSSKKVIHRRARSLRVASRPGMWFNADGELLTKSPVTFTIRPAALEIVVGEGYTPEPPPEA